MAVRLCSLASSLVSHLFSCLFWQSADCPAAGVGLLRAMAPSGCIFKLVSSCLAALQTSHRPPNWYSQYEVLNPTRLFEMVKQGAKYGNGEGRQARASGVRSGSGKRWIMEGVGRMSLHLEQKVRGGDHKLDSGWKMEWDSWKRWWNCFRGEGEQKKGRVRVGCFFDTVDTIPND